MLATKEGLLRFTLLRPQAGVGAIAALGLANPFFLALFCRLNGGGPDWLYSFAQHVSLLYRLLLWAKLSR
jgi:hypothetical protein